MRFTLHKLHKPDFKQQVMATNNKQNGKQRMHEVSEDISKKKEDLSPL